MALPASVQLPCLPFDVAFHPSQHLVCAGLISGSVELDSFSISATESEGASEEEGAKPGGPAVTRCWRKKAHKQACRAVAFMDQGNTLLSASSDHSLVLRDADTGKRTWANLTAHNAAINRLASISEMTVASGDDDGTIKVWDVRQPSCCASMSVHDDFIADMHHAGAREKLLAVSGDGTLSVFDLRHFKKEARSEYAEDELLSVTVVKNGRKVVCGSQEGVLLLYSWGHFNDCSDRFPGHPQSIDALLKLDEDTVVTGSQDGLIRLISILPNSFRGVIGQHMDCPIERLALCGDGSVLASASHDNLIKFWDLSALGSLDEDDEGPRVDGEQGTADLCEDHCTTDASADRKRAQEFKSSKEENSDSDEEKQPKKMKHSKKRDKASGKNLRAAQKNTFFADL